MGKNCSFCLKCIHNCPVQAVQYGKTEGQNDTFSRKGLLVMKNSYMYFKNDSCKYMPCHKGIDGEDFNCLFCYCPMNRYGDCLGTPQYITMENGSRIKDCSNCTFPHKAENYHKIIEFLSHKAKSINEK